MTAALTRFTRRYRRALRAALSASAAPGLGPAQALAIQAREAGMRQPALTALHHGMLRAQLLLLGPRQRRAAARHRAGRLLKAVLAPPRSTARRDVDAHAQTGVLAGLLGHRTAELARTNTELSREIAARKSAETALRASTREQGRTLRESASLQQRLRLLSRQLLGVQEVERKTISRELHDVIAQTLTGITLRLGALKHEAETDSLQHTITRTQRLVTQAVDLVHRFARGLRPAVLDDLGLVPALHAALQAFTLRSGIRARLIASPRAEQLSSEASTVLFRVAQEALTNVERHAHASNVRVTVALQAHGVGMDIHDDGRSFKAGRASASRGGARLGLLAMRERLEMVGGTLAIDSASGQGTTLSAHIPLPKPVGGGRATRSSSLPESRP